MRLWGDYMKDNQLIIEYYEGDKEQSIKVIDIKPYPNYSEHYYEVLYKNNEGEFTDVVFIQNNMVLVLPE